MVNAEQQPLRPIWMSTLAKAPLPLLEQCVETLEHLPEYGLLRAPEIGLAMVRGRAEGTGPPFNLGEITITRCVVQLGEDRKSTRLNSSHPSRSRMPSSA